MVKKNFNGSDSLLEPGTDFFFFFFNGFKTRAMNAARRAAFIGGTYVPSMCLDILTNYKKVSVTTVDPTRTAPTVTCWLLGEHHEGGL